MVLVLIFSKFDMYLPYKNRFWGLFSWFCCQGTNSNVWTRSGSKVDFKVVVSKGLIKSIQELNEKINLLESKISILESNKN